MPRKTPNPCWLNLHTESIACLGSIRRALSTTKHRDQTKINACTDIPSPWPLAWSSHFVTRNCVFCTMCLYLPGKWSGKNAASFIKNSRTIHFCFAFCTNCCTVANSMSSLSLQFQTVYPMENLGALVQASLISVTVAQLCTPSQRSNIVMDQSLLASPARKAELAKVESEMILTWCGGVAGTTNYKQKTGSKWVWFQSLLFCWPIPGVTRNTCLDLSCILTFSPRTR